MSEQNINLSLSYNWSFESNEKYAYLFLVSEKRI